MNLKVRQAPRRQAAGGQEGLGPGAGGVAGGYRHCVPRPDDGDAAEADRVEGARRAAARAAPGCHRDGRDRRQPRGLPLKPSLLQ